MSRPKSAAVFLLEGLECSKDTQMKVYNITKLVAELKRYNVQYRNEIYVQLCLFSSADLAAIFI